MTVMDTIVVILLVGIGIELLVIGGLAIGQMWQWRKGK